MEPCYKDIVLDRIERCIAHLISSIVGDESPTLSYRNMQKWTNISFKENNGLGVVDACSRSEIKFDKITTARHFCLMVKIMEIVYRLVQENSYSTKRDIYYGNAELFGKQSSVDDAVRRVSCLLGIPRWELHVLATSKGCVTGSLTYYENDVFMDCNTGTPTLIPMHIQALTNIHTEAQFVLIVEKDATFQKLLDQAICNKVGPCVIVTAKGFPDVNTRMLLRRLWDEHRLPMYALVDADPHGIEIMAIYKYGSRTLAMECDHLTVPTLRWIGVFPSDIQRFRLPSCQLLDITAIDKRKAQSLLKRPYIVNDALIAREVILYTIEELLRSGKKAEIQSLCAISSTFLTDVYLPAKLQLAGWI